MKCDFNLDTFNSESYKIDEKRRNSSFKVITAQNPPQINNVRRLPTSKKHIFCECIAEKNTYGPISKNKKNTFSVY